MKTRAPSTQGVIIGQEPHTARGEPVSSDYHNKNASRSIVDEIYCRAASRP
eukprot:COSAG01_NODE_16769_length_1206_cov_1.967480_1_plen_50_part_10